MRVMEALKERVIEGWEVDEEGYVTLYNKRLIVSLKASGGAEYLKNKGLISYGTCQKCKEVKREIPLCLIREWESAISGFKYYFGPASLTSPYCKECQEVINARPESE